MIALRVFCLSISSICQFTIDSSSLFLHFFRWRPCVCRQHCLVEMFDASKLKCRATDANCLSFCSSSALPTLKCWILRLFSRYSAHWLNCFFLLFPPFWLPFYTLCSNFFPFFPLHSASFCLFLFFSFFIWIDARLIFVSHWAPNISLLMLQHPQIRLALRFFFFLCLLFYLITRTYTETGTVIGVLLNSLLCPAVHRQGCWTPWWWRWWWSYTFRTVAVYLSFVALLYTCSLFLVWRPITAGRNKNVSVEKKTRVKCSV